jgi:hypothetical protein
LLEIGRAMFVRKHFVYEPHPQCLLVSHSRRMKPQQGPDLPPMLLDGTPIPLVLPEDLRRQAQLLGDIVDYRGREF